MDNDFAELIRSLSSDEIKARLPERAAKFFTEHPPLFQAWRLRFENPAQGKQIEHDYFMTMPPDAQYGLVYEISELHRAVGSLEAAFLVVKQYKVDSMLDDARRYVRYGVNLHMTSEQYNRIVMLMAEHITATRVRMQSTTDSRLAKELLNEIDQNKVLFDSLNEQFGKFYPELLASVTGKRS